MKRAILSFYRGALWEGLNYALVDHLRMFKKMTFAETTSVIVAYKFVKKLVSHALLFRS